MSKQERGPVIIASCAVFFIFWAFYFQLGSWMAATGLLDIPHDVLFGADIKRNVDDIANFRAEHWRTRTHPMFVLFFNPPGEVLKHLAGSAATAAILLNSASGALCAGASVALFRRLMLPLSTAVLMSCLLGLTAAHVFFGSIPETYIFSAAGLILHYIAFVRRPGALRYFVPLGVFSLGVLVTNFAQGGILFFFSLPRRQAPRYYLTRMALYGGSVLGVSGALNVAQKVVHPETGLFFLPRVVTYEMKFVDSSRPVDRAKRIGFLAEHLILLNVVAPRPDVSDSHPPSVTFEPHHPPRLHAPGMAAMALWLTLVARSAWNVARRGLLGDPLCKALLACMGFNLVLHSVYGYPFFLYVCNWTAASVVLVARSIGGPAKAAWPAAGTNALLTALVALLATNNIMVFLDCVKAFELG